MEEFQKLFVEYGLEDKVTVNLVGCFGFCSQGPFVKIYPEDTLYRGVTVANVRTIIEKDFINHEIVEELLYIDPNTNKKCIKHKFR